jgi:hypothetical protein
MSYVVSEVDSIAIGYRSDANPDSSLCYVERLLNGCVNAGPGVRYQMALNIRIIAQP